MQQHCLSHGGSFALVVCVTLTVGLSGKGLASFQDEATQSRLKAPALLSQTEVSQVVAAMRGVLANRPFRVAARGGAATSYRTDAGGRLLFAYTNEAITQYTGRPAKYCDGSPSPGELVVDFRNTNGKWTSSARPSTPIEPGPMFEALSGTLPLQDGGVTDGGEGRDFHAVWSPPSLSVDGRPQGGTGGFTWRLDPPDPSVSTIVRIVLAVQSLLPVRWELVASSATMPQVTIPYRFEYEDVAEPLIPESVSIPACIDPRNPFPSR
jgi:hypothetical protein